MEFREVTEGTPRHVGSVVRGKENGCRWCVGKKKSKGSGEKRVSEELGRGNTEMSWFDNGENSRHASARRGWKRRDDKNRLKDENRAIVHTLQRRRNSRAATFGGTDEE